jgi:hypothetical protein
MTTVTACAALGRRSGCQGWRVRWREGTGSHYHRIRRSYWTETRAEAEALRTLLSVPGTTLDAALHVLHARQGPR